jgi:potassium channel subfamily K
MLALLSILKLNDKKIQFLAINILFIIGFSLIYWIWGTHEHFKSQFSAPYLSSLDALYFSFVTHCTLGYGDIVPISASMRFITILHTIVMISYLFLVGL